MNYEFDVSDDGSFMVLSIAVRGTSHLAVRRLSSLTAVPMPGTEQGTDPIVSPDGWEVAFVAGGRIIAAFVAGGVVRTLADSSQCCLRWGNDGYIYFLNSRNGLSRAPATGGSQESIIEPQQGEQYGDFEVDTEDKVAVFTVWGTPHPGRTTRWGGTARLSVASTRSGPTVVRSSST